MYRILNIQAMNSILKSVLREDQIFCPFSKREICLYSWKWCITPLKNKPAEIPKPLQSVRRY